MIVGMDKIRCSYYTLERKDSSKAKRRGALLKIQFQDGLIGYSDCHPWSELGDPPLEDQLRALKTNKWTNLLESSLAFARLDAEARHQKKSLFTQKKIPQSHFLIMDVLDTHSEDIEKILLQGFTHIKIKMGTTPEQEVARVIELFSNSSLKIRLDFNEKLSLSTYQSLLKQLNSIAPSIDYIEDPIPFEAKAWKQIKKESRIPIACDRQVLKAAQYPDSYSFLIVKAALFIPANLTLSQEKMIVTTYLDHPLGQMGAAYRAAHIDPNGKNIHGLLSHHSYQTNPFSRQLSQQGPHFKVPLGYGFGYDELLENAEWKPLL